jgi:hypothetical protein
VTDLIDIAQVAGEELLAADELERVIDVDAVVDPDDGDREAARREVER